MGEGAFGLVFKGMIRGPLRNPKLSSKLRQTIGLQVAIKLLKGNLGTQNDRNPPDLNSIEYGSVHVVA